MNQQICLQINYKQDNNGKTIFDNYKIVDNTGNAVQRTSANSTIYDNIKSFVNSSSWGDTISTSLSIIEDSKSSLSSTAKVINISYSAFQNYTQQSSQSSDTTKNLILAGINTVVETAVGGSYGAIGFIAGGGSASPISAVAGAVSFSYAASKYYENNLEQGFNNFLSKTYDALFNSNDSNKLIVYNQTTQIPDIYSFYNQSKTQTSFSSLGLNYDFNKNSYNGYTFFDSNKTFKLGDFTPMFSNSSPSSSLLNSIKNLGSALNHASPLAIDLDDDGIESINMKDGVFFDIKNTGFQNKIVIC